MSKIKITRNISLILFALVPIVIVFAAFFFGKNISEVFPKLFSQISEEEIRQTKDNCDNFKLLPTFRKVRDNQIIKSGSANFSTEYTSTDKPETVKSYFMNLLIPQGWEFSDKDISEGIIFYKDKYSISIEYSNISFGSEREYVVGCSWQSSRYGLIGDLFH